MRYNVYSAVNQQERPGYKNQASSETIRRIPHIDREMAILLGILFTDGCVSPRQKNSWRLYFVNKSDVLVTLFRDCMVQIFGLERSRVRLGKTADGLTQAVVDSKEIGTYLVQTFGTFRTLKYKNGKLPQTKLPVQLLIESGYSKEFLQTAFSCDGGLRLYTAKRQGTQGGTQWLIRTVFLSCAHPKLREDYHYLLSSLGIRSINAIHDRKIKIETEVNIRKFQSYIGFIPGVRATNDSKYWHGWEKNKVLDTMVASYGHPSTIYNLSKFKVKTR